MLVSDFDYDLPEELIAQAPPKVRGSSRMLVLHRSAGTLVDDRFTSLPDYLRAGDVLVLNDSRVLPARLYATRAGRRTQSPSPSGRIEVLLTQQLGGSEWTALVRPGRKVQLGEQLHFASNEGETLLTAEVIATADFGRRTLRFAPDPAFFAKLDRIGHMPLPPYIHRNDAAEDLARYQTVYANQPGSAAAPTAGLHFTPEILAAIRAKGIQIETVTLHVGLGTFQPVRVAAIDDIHLHAERYSLSQAAADAVNTALRESRRVIAAGTTTVRVLEHCATLSAGLHPHSGETSIFLAPGHRFQAVHALLTNFHLPQSTLLMLVSAFAGIEPVREAYRHAVRERYRFFSYGDCMFID